MDENLAILALFPVFGFVEKYFSKKPDIIISAIFSDILNLGFTRLKQVRALMQLYHYDGV